MVNRSHLRVVSDVGNPAEPTLTIDCDKCVVKYTCACDECLVTHIVGREIGRPVELASDEVRAVQLLADAGLVPGSRFLREEPVA